MNDHYKNEGGLDVSDLESVFTVFTGHYHKQQDLGNVHYIGSPWQTRADEAGQPKGYVIWDGAEFTRVDTHWGKRYHIIKLDKGEDLDLTDVEAGDEVRVTAADGVDLRKLAKALDATGAAARITKEEATVEERLAPKSDTLSSFAEAYVELKSGELDRDKLMGLFKELTA